jgi:PAS domain S-box-containing protein
MLPHRATTEADLHRYLEASQTVGVGWWRADGTVIRANDAFLRLTGFSREDLRAGLVRWPEITPPEFAQYDEHALEEIQKRGYCSPFAKEYVRKDGTRVGVLIGAASFGSEKSGEGVFFAVELPDSDSAENSIPQPSGEMLTERQRVVCLLLSYGESDKRIAYLLNVGLRTVELDKHNAAKKLHIETSDVLIWSVEHRRHLREVTRNSKMITDAIRALFSRWDDSRTLMVDSKAVVLGESWPKVDAMTWVI